MLSVSRHALAALARHSLTHDPVGTKMPATTPPKRIIHASNPAFRSRVIKPSLHKHAALLVPTFFPVTLLAFFGAVKRNATPGAFHEPFPCLEVDLRLEACAAPPCL